ncbi:spore maturation protein CgeB [Sphingomonas jejuensis]|uniref:Spore maturation protein CgeB n=1 Tax=Sphingomonas jejuensis TaxID=904715 RepID=A0ABX0XMU4_9SPHN|nr:glycosyltransferase [Sphingomonas jejuensis]NJC34011.1 spore maturation protein CgeB [Sphingomonas jejuensis]
MRIRYFTHSLRSCWNHGNAHFLRGLLADLQRRGHDVAAIEPADNWSLANLAADAGPEGQAAFRAAYPDLGTATYDVRSFDADQAIDGADLVIVHEWTDPAVVAAIGAARRRGGRFQLFFHDTHHRAVSDPDAIRAFDLDGYDAVLAFGETLSEVYRRWGWGDRVFTWHEAADTFLFRPPLADVARDGTIWIGNWGDGERTAELEEFLLAPTRDVGIPLDIHGVRYPAEALLLLDRYDARYRGWIANAAAPAAYARHLLTVHVPRRFYTQLLPGIPTIRVFEALACGIPLVSAPWDDAEGLFRPGDYLKATDGDAMRGHLRDLVADPALAADLARRGRETIEARHSCAHRADELLAISRQIDATRSTKRTAA